MRVKFIPGLIDLSKVFKTTKHFKLGLDFLKALTRISTLPFIHKIHPWTKKSKTNMYWIPVNESLQRPQDVPLPYSVVEEFIERSEHRVIMDFCGCRKAYNCENFPIELGCLLMGDDAQYVSPRFSRPVTKDEARAHVKWAMESGLPPIIGKARIDNYIFGIPDRGKMLTVCFCCNCCCIVNFIERLPSGDRNEIIKPLDGLRVSVDRELCTGCGKCLDNCFIHVISMDGDKAFISNDCRGCGRCIPACSQKAIKISLDNPDYVKKTVDDILKYVKI